MEDLINKCTPEGFTIYQLEELEEKKEEKIQELYCSPLKQFCLKYEQTKPCFQLTSKGKTPLPKVFEKVASKTVEQVAKLCAQANITLCYPKEIANMKLYEVAKFKEEVPLVKKNCTILPKNRLGRWIGTSFALEGKKAYGSAIYISSLNIMPARVNPTQNYEITIEVKPGATLPGFLKSVASKKVKEAAQLAAFAGIKLVYDEKYQNVVFKNLCKFSTKAVYLPNFLIGVKKDVEANQAYAGIKEWFEKLSEEDKKFLLESYIKEDGIPIKCEGINVSEAPRVKRKGSIFEQLRSMKKWVQNGKTIFEGGVWHVPLKEAVKMLKQDITYDATQITQAFKEKLKKDFSKSYIPYENGIPQKLLLYGFFLINGKRKLPVGLMSRMWNKDMLYAHKGIRKYIALRKKQAAAQRKQKKELFSKHYKEAMDLLKNNVKEFNNVLASINEKIQKVAYLKAKKDFLANQKRSA
ncbi:MAG TPA: hypothetical protein ENF67_00250 [Candidatus Pacearchaeota archaeon]|nr:hypothetical protein [Candidatus Pacearchaeota archaeon]